MTIIIVGPAHPLRGGIAAFNERFCATLISQGHDCQIISYSLQYPSVLFPGKSQKDEDSPPPNIPIFPLINSINPFSWWKTANYISGQKPDIIIFRFWIPFMGPALGTIQRILKVKNCRFAALIDNLIPHEKRPGDRVLTKYFLQHIPNFIVMSQAVKNDLLNLKPGAKVIIQNHPIYDHYGESVDSKEARSLLQIKQDKKVILFFGLVRKYKGLDLLLEALAVLKNKPDYLLLVAGEFYESIDEYKHLAERLGLMDRVLWHDRFIPNDMVRFYFSACNLLVLPYRTATQSGVTQVAFHFETPVIITNVGGLSEIILDGINGLVAEPTTFDLAEKLDNFFEKDLEKSLRSGMKKEKNKYSWEKFAMNILDFLKHS